MPITAAASPGAAPQVPGGKGREELPEVLPPVPGGAAADGGLQCQAGPLPRAHSGVSTLVEHVAQSSYRYSFGMQLLNS